jgi:hypothetical protein
MNRRDFLKALTATSLAPFIPAIAASTALETIPLDDIIAGRVNLFITLANENGVIKSIERQPVNLNEAIQFCEITEPCSVTHAIIGTDDGSWSTEVRFDSHRQVTAMPGDSVTVSKLNISYA